MKKIILIIAMFQMIICNCYSQWVQQFSPVNHHLTNVKFANERMGWITTYSGSIMRTTNSGVNWIVQYTIPGKFMFGLSVVDSNTVYAVGWFETIVKTTNGGENWTEIRNGLFGEGHSYQAVNFINNNTGWVCGTGNLIFKTIDGGLTFDSTVVSGRFYDIYFRNEYEGLVCGQSAGMYSTTDGGIIWTEIIVPVGMEAADFFSLTFVNENTGYTQGVQNSKVYKTTNFGLTWDSLSRIPQALNMRCLYFSSLSTGWSCGDDNHIYKTTDAGIIWRRENTSQFSPWGYRSIYFVNDTIGWSVGTAGKIINTTNGGLTFINSVTNILPEYFFLEQNYPNPFNAQTRIYFHIKKNGKYKMEIYNSLGQFQETLFDGIKTAGYYTLTYDAENLSSGIYFYILSSDIDSQTKKFLLIK